MEARASLRPAQIGVLARSEGVRALRLTHEQMAGFIPSSYSRKEKTVAGRVVYWCRAATTSRELSRVT